MLPINLLPSHYGDKDKKRNAIIGMVVLVAAAAIIMFYFYNEQVKLYNAAVEEKTTAENFKTKFDAQVTAINKVKAKIADTETKQTFVESAQKYNDSWPAAFDMIRNLTSPDVLLKNMAFTDTSHKTISMAVFAGSEDIMYRWWKQLKTHNDIFESVRFDFKGRPYDPEAATAGGAGGSAGMLSGPGMAGGKGPGSSGGPAAPMMSAPGGSYGMPGSSGGGASGGDPVGPAEIEGRPGVNFNVTLVLRQPMDNGAAAPAWTGSGAPAAAAPGGFPGGGPAALSAPGGRGKGD